jgi:hypothetical protein
VSWSLVTCMSCLTLTVYNASTRIFYIWVEELTIKTSLFISWYGVLLACQDLLIINLTINSCPALTDMIAFTYPPPCF